MRFVIMIYAHTDRTGKGTGIQDYLRKHIVQIETGSMNIINKTVEFYKKGDYMIKRDKYLRQLISNKDNGFPKVITGIRRCGK